MNIKVREGIATDSILQSVKEQDIFWSDGRDCHFIMDYKHDGKWISSVCINNELTEMTIDII
jgi:hypothetical protein